jgi:tetratricopeptide (TPR) repeat protein
MADDKEKLLKEAEKLISERKYGSAAELFAKAGEPEKAKEFYIKSAEKWIASRDYDWAADSYMAAGMTEKAKECLIQAAERHIAKKEYGWAAEAYAKVGETEKEKECYLKQAGGFIVSENYTAAVVYYKLANVSLTALPKESLEKILGLVREGNVAVTQGLAAIVKTDEEELMFNEARAGMVL